MGRNDILWLVYFDNGPVRNVYLEETFAGAERRIIEMFTAERDAILSDDSGASAEDAAAEAKDSVHLYTGVIDSRIGACPDFRIAPYSIVTKEIGIKLLP